MPSGRALYITSARLSSSRSSTGREQPAISTRPAASIAACGETPYPRPIRKTCKTSAASLESTMPPCSKSFRKADNSVTENFSLMAVLTFGCSVSLDSSAFDFVVCNPNAVTLVPYGSLFSDALSHENPRVCKRLRKACRRGSRAFHSGRCGQNDTMCRPEMGQIELLWNGEVASGRNCPRSRRGRVEESKGRHLERRHSASIVAESTSMMGISSWIG